MARGACRDGRRWLPPLESAGNVQRPYTSFAVAAPAAVGERPRAASQAARTDVPYSASALPCGFCSHGLECTFVRRGSRAWTRLPTRCALPRPTWARVGPFLHGNAQREIPARAVARDRRAGPNQTPMGPMSSWTLRIEEGLTADGDGDRSTALDRGKRPRGDARRARSAGQLPGLADEQALRSDRSRARPRGISLRRSAPPPRRVRGCGQDPTACTIAAHSAFSRSHSRRLIDLHGLRPKPRTRPSEKPVPKLSMATCAPSFGAHVRCDQRRRTHQQRAWNLDAHLVRGHARPERARKSGNPIAAAAVPTRYGDGRFTPLLATRRAGPRRASPSPMATMVPLSSASGRKSGHHHPSKSSTRLLMKRARRSRGRSPAGIRGRTLFRWAHAPLDVGIAPRAVQSADGAGTCCARVPSPGTSRRRHVSRASRSASSDSSRCRRSRRWRPRYR